MTPSEASSTPLVVPRAWQFQLWQLFATMTYVACAAGVARYWGVQTLVTTLGLGVAILNWAGVFERCQRGRAQVAILLVSWGMFLVSLGLPSLGAFGIPGWGAAWVALISPLIFVEQIGKGTIHWPQLLVLGSSLANILQLFVPLLIWRLRTQRGQWLATGYFLAMVSAWVTGWLYQTDDLLVGYYVWCASFMVGLIAVPVRSQTLIGMGVVASVLLVVVQLSGGSKPFVIFDPPIVQPAPRSVESVKPSDGNE